MISACTSRSGFSVVVRSSNSDYPLQGTDQYGPAPLRNSRTSTRSFERDRPRTVRRAVPMSITELTDSGRARSRSSSSRSEVGVQLRHELDRATLAERRLDRLERLASAKREGAEDEGGVDSLPTHVLGNPPRRAFASRRERAVDFGECRIRPARLPLPKPDDRSHCVTVPARTVGAKQPARPATSRHRFARAITQLR
jgi:hypothetical protein